MLATGLAVTGLLTVTTGITTAGAKTAKIDAAAANAAANVIENSPPAGYRVVFGPEATAFTGIQTHSSVTCPGTTKPAGGGVATGATSTLVNVNSSYPTGTRDWAADVNNSSGADTSMQVWAVCVNRTTTNFTVNTASFTAAKNRQTSGVAGCPAGVVVGGGVFVNTSNTLVNVNTLYPSSTTTWRADVNNATTVKYGFKVYAICRLTAPKGYSVQGGTPVPNPAGSQTSAIVHCPGNSLPMSGGVFSSSSSLDVNLNESIPSGNAWLIYQNNASGVDATATPWVICAGK